jgi:PAS domain S-box-containing protein
VLMQEVNSRTRDAAPGSGRTSLFGKALLRNSGTSPEPAEMLPALVGEARGWGAEFRAIAQGVDEAIVVREPGGQIVYANDNAARLLGFDSVEELVATPIAEVNPRFEFYTESGERVSDDRLPGILALEGIERPTTVMRFHFVLTGEERWAKVKAMPIKDDLGHVQNAASIFSDITEQRLAQEALKASEARFQAFMDNSPIVAFIKDEEARFVYVNPQFERVFQVNASEIIGVADMQLVPADVAQRIHEDDREVMSTGKMKQIVEVIPTPDGTLRTWMTFKFPMTVPPEDRSKKSTRKARDVRRFVAGASIEITERVQAQQEVERYAERLQTLSRQLIEAQEAERSRVARDLHDQIGQVLTAVKIDLQVAQRQVSISVAGTSGATSSSPGSQDLSALGQRLEQSIKMVDHAIQQVRTFSLDLRPSMLDDLGLDSALLWYVEEQARRSGLKAELAVEQLSTRLPAEIEITCFRVAQEAITNIVRHARASCVRVALRRSGDEIELVVTDDGVGFAAQPSTEFTFERGERLLPLRTPHTPSITTARISPKSPESAQAEPSGASEGRRDARDETASQLSNLGLVGMYERTRLVGGRLSIESEPGKGTTVRAFFPLFLRPI